MPHFQEKRVLGYSREDMYRLVADVESYPKFLPWCLHAEIHEQSAKHQVTDLVIGWKIFREKFKSHVDMEKGHKIASRAIEGPFEHLRNEWIFKDHKSGGCEVGFMVDFEFRSPILKKVIEPLFFPAVQKMISAFENRAMEIYAKQ